MSNGLYMRRADVLEETGWSPYVLRKLRAAKALKPVFLVKGGKAHYLRAKVEALARKNTT